MFVKFYEESSWKHNAVAQIFCTSIRWSLKELPKTNDQSGPQASHLLIAKLFGNMFFRLGRYWIATWSFFSPFCICAFSFWKRRKKPKPYWCYLVIVKWSNADMSIMKMIFRRSLMLMVNLTIPNLRQWTKPLYSRCTDSYCNWLVNVCKSSQVNRSRNWKVF